MERSLIAYGVPLFQVTSIKYIWRVLAAEDDDCPAVVRNLRRASQKWARLTHILIREGSDARTLVHIYFFVVEIGLLLP